MPHIFLRSTERFGQKQKKLAITDSTLKSDMRRRTVTKNRNNTGRKSCEIIQRKKKTSIRKFVRLCRDKKIMKTQEYKLMVMTRVKRHELVGNYSIRDGVDKEIE